MKTGIRMIKASIQQKASNARTPGCFKNVHLKGDIDSNIIITEDFSVLLLSMEKSTRQKINKATTELIYTMGLTNLIDIIRIFYPTVAEYTTVFHQFMELTPG